MMKNYLCSCYTGPCEAARVAKGIGGKSGTERAYVAIMASSQDAAKKTFQHLCAGVFSVPKEHEITAKEMNETDQELWYNWK